MRVFPFAFIFYDVDILIFIIILIEMNILFCYLKPFFPVFEDLDLLDHLERNEYGLILLFVSKRAERF